jgi:glycosyltransferase involved in cell wall biosynthesis
LIATDVRLVADKQVLYDGLRLRGISHDKRQIEIRETIARFSPDAIFTQPWWHDVALRLGREAGVPTIFRVTDWPMPIPFFVDNPFSPSHVIVQTKEVEQALQCAGCTSTLLPAFIDLNRVRSNNPKTRRYITMFNPIEAKGGFIFRAIAESMPDRAFAVVPGWWSLRDQMGNFDTELFRRAYESQGRVYDGWVPDEPDFRALENVVILRARDEVADIFDQTRIVLVPSLWKEQFGRVIFEAAANGAAVIASGMASLRENAGDAAAYVNDFQNVSSWAEAIMQFDDPVAYAERSRSGQQYVLENYNLDRTVAKFHALLHDVVGRSHEVGFRSENVMP